MDAFFSKPMNFGRFPDRTRGDLFAREREYFDQVLRKNLLFRRSYAEAYGRWADRLLSGGISPTELVLARVREGIRRTGEERTQELFSAAAAAVNAFLPDNPRLPENTPYEETLPGGAVSRDPLWAGHMRSFKKMWLRLALPDVREE